MSVRSLLALPVLVLAACGGDDGNKTDASTGIDAKASNVMEVTCPATTTVTFTTLDTFVFMPASASTTVGTTVKFVSSNATHPIGPIPLNQQSDPGLVVPGGQTKCFNFLVAGMYKFECTQHSFVGTLTVN